MTERKAVRPTGLDHRAATCEMCYSSRQRKNDPKDSESIRAASLVSNLRDGIACSSVGEVASA